MREAVVVASSRTPLAKSHRGSFNMTRPDDIAAHCITNVLGKVPQLDPKEIEDVILGCAQPNGAQGNNVARVALVVSLAWFARWALGNGRAAALAFGLGLFGMGLGAPMAILGAALGMGPAGDPEVAHHPEHFGK